MGDKSKTEIDAFDIKELKGKVLLETGEQYATYVLIFFGSALFFGAIFYILDLVMISCKVKFYMERDNAKRITWRD